MDLLARAIELKPELVHYATSGRFARELTAVLDRFYAEAQADEAAAFLPVDYFTHQHRLPGGDTVIDRFVGDRPDLDDADRELVLSWKDVVEGVFEVRQGEDGGAVLLFNLVDELAYLTRSNLGDDAFDALAPGMFVVGRLVPLGGDWLISGTPSVHTAEARATLVPVAAHIAMDNPAVVFRNPEALARAWELQAEHRRCFITYFGADLVVLPGADVRERMSGYLDYQYERLGGHRPSFAVPEHVREADTVALIYDADEGLGYYAEFGRLAEVFERPELVAKGLCRDLVTAYLKGDAVSPVPLVRLATRDPGKAGEVFARLLGRAGFRWERSGEALLRTHKPGRSDAPRLPSVIPMTAAIKEHLG
ncbi:hypothetical protein OIE66_14215 [Nonomuraea sp. NBC_01738]|uniref:hypothetical protein n=1 Tax=Nonomuraea sp. NBC_01738 TaxID=2976003 RepID=UPI002E103242|nr:hypothetical protein OIE66_14215 [Nonomuraea sp. NBC_01738]